ncbi:hypothetical protein [uncultured Enterococcus sp.]|uniref:hypothetical protein n=1 Tax=uncultured Enterococcus sp. TaxID=167972 RepID=UPI002AA96051|nr:hypothetical protein [uncultured Enterococcus sp.]
MKKIKKIVKYLVSIVIVLILTSPFLLIPAINNMIIWRMENNLKNIPLPDETSQIQTKGIVGKLNGNGNGVNYLATLVVESNQTLGDLERYYQSYNAQINIIKQSSYKFKSKLLEHGDLSYQKLKGTREFSNYFTIYSYEAAKNGSVLEWDFRGH